MLMKASRVRRAVVILILLCMGLTGAACADSVRPSLTIGPIFSYGTADIYEYVFYNQKLEKESELDWDLHNFCEAGGSLQFKSDYVNFNFQYSQLLYNEPGFMQDYDWLKTSDLSHLTNYSIHDNLIKKHQDFLIEAGVPFARGKAQAAFTLGAQYMWTDMEGWNGYKTYENEGWQEIPFDGLTISYRQKLQLFWTGISTDIQVLPGLCYSLAIAVNPVVFADCVDIHWARETTVVFHDTPDYGTGLKISTSLCYNIFRHSQIALSCRMIGLPECVGNTSCNGELSSGLSGTGYVGWDVSLSYRIRIF